MRALSSFMTLLLCGGLLLAGQLLAGCGLLQQWREDGYRRYHRSRFEPVAQLQAFGSAKYPTGPEAPGATREEIEPGYRKVFDQQAATEKVWLDLLDNCGETVKLVSDATSALAQRDGVGITNLTPQLTEAMGANRMRFESWQAQRAEAAGSLQALQIKWQELWPENDLNWDTEVEIDRLRRESFSKQIEKTAADGAKSGGKSGSAEARHEAQQLETQFIAELQRYHDDAYDLLASRYLGRAIEEPQIDMPKAPAGAALIASQLEQLEASLAARYELDLGIEAELERFEYVTGYKLEDLLELPQEGSAQTAGEKPSDKGTDRAQSKGKAKPKAPLDRRTLWAKLQSGQLPSLTGRKDKQLKGHRKESVEISLARLEYYRQLDELLSRCIAVQQRELDRQWEIAWPNPAVETSIFEYAKTLPEAAAAPEAVDPALQP